MEPIKPQKFCFNCGAPVGPQDCEYIGYNRIYCCGDGPCERELRGEQQAAEESRAEDAREDGFSRY